MNISPPLTVWIVEDDSRYRQTIATLLRQSDQTECPETFGDTETLLAALRVAPTAARSDGAAPDVLLLDIHLPGQTGIEALPDIRAAAPDTAVIILTIAQDPDLIFQAFQSGALGYLLKDAPVSDIHAAIQHAAAGGTLMPPVVADHVLSYFRTAPPSAYDLTKREREVLKLMTEGRSQRQIAEDLFVSPHTVNSHVQNLYVKLQVNSGIEAVAKAVRERIV